jgi:hypothetical protein
MGQCRYPKFARLIVLISMHIKPQSHPSPFADTGPVMRDITADRGWRYAWDMSRGLIDQCNAVRDLWVPNPGVIVLPMLQIAVRPLLVPEFVFVELKLVLAIFAIRTK